MDDLNRAAGICPFCGAKVEPNWALCDSCGQRLPWAPPKKLKSLSELSDEELAARFAPSREPVTPAWATFLKTWPGKFTLMLVSSVIWEIINKLFLHLY
jgi:hypothetical protein